MYSLISNFGISGAMKKELVPLTAAFLIADFFYKWQSFALECLGFLATWFVLSLILSKIFKT